MRKLAIRCAKYPIMQNLDFHISVLGSCTQSQCCWKCLNYTKRLFLFIPVMLTLWQVLLPIMIKTGKFSFSHSLRKECFFFVGCWTLLNSPWPLCLRVRLLATPTRVSDVLFLFPPLFLFNNDPAFQQLPRPPTDASCKKTASNFLFATIPKASHGSLV